jgi:hypothetical protein
MAQVETNVEIRDAENRVVSLAKFPCTEQAQAYAEGFGYDPGEYAVIRAFCRSIGVVASWTFGFKGAVHPLA